jgi:hypothetical protein
MKTENVVVTRRKKKGGWGAKFTYEKKKGPKKGSKYFGCSKKILKCVQNCCGFFV